VLNSNADEKPELSDQLGMGDGSFKRKTRRGAWAPPNAQLGCCDP